MHWICRTAITCLLPVIAGPALAAPVNINSADAQSIAAALTGVGEQKAKAIVDYRTAKGPFASADGLTQVKGIGQATVDKNRSDIIIDQPAAK
jgi:competence protein ComEA